MSVINKTFILVIVLYFSLHTIECAKINTPRVLLPWLDNMNVNFTFEIIEGGCYSWSLSRDDIIDIEPLYEDSWGHCSRAARVSVSKSCSPPGSVIILAEEVSTGEILRGDVDIDKISYLKVMSTTWKLYLEEAPEAFEVVAYDDQGNTFSTLEGISFEWSIKNLGNNVGDDPLVTLVRWSDTDYEAPRGITHLEGLGLRGSSVLLYGQAMGSCAVTACLGRVCADFELSVVASVVLTPAVAAIAPGDTLRYRVVRARAGRLTVQDVSETLYRLTVPDSNVAELEDAVSLVRGGDIGSTPVHLLSGSTEVATATLTVAEPHSIKVSLRPSSLLVRGESFLIHCTVLTEDGHALTAGDQMLIRLNVEGRAGVDLLRSTENGTLTDAVAQFAGDFLVTAALYSVAGRSLSRKVEGSTSGLAVDPLEVIPPELYVAWTESVQEIQLLHRGGGSEPVTWSEAEGERQQHALSLSNAGVVTVNGVGEVGVKVQLLEYGYVRAFGRVWSAVPESIQVSSSGQARVGRPHHLHVALRGQHPVSGELFNFHRCDCGSFTVSLLEGPEPYNVTAATYVLPEEGACCVLEATWRERGVATVHVSRGRVGDTARVQVRAAPRLVWPEQAAALVGATLPVLALGDALLPTSSEPRTSELTFRDGPPPHRYPDLQLFTFKCKRKGESRLQLTSQSEEEPESVEFEAACAQHVSRIRLEPPGTPGNCSGGPRLWLVPGHEVKVQVTLLDAIGRELLDERGPKTTWESSPKHAGIEYRSADRLFIETHPEYVPVPVPHKYYQVVIADEQAIGWTGALKTNVPEATASIQAKVVPPLTVDPIKMNLAWEGESLSNIASVTGGSGRYVVVEAAGVTARVDDGKVVATVPAPGTYQLRVEDLCVQQSAIIELNVEEIVSVEVSTAPAVCTDACAPITAVARGASRRTLSYGGGGGGAGGAEWRVAGDVRVEAGRVCGVREGAGRVRAAVAGVWSKEVEIVVFPPLAIIPPDVRLPAGAKLQLSHAGGPPAHLATLHYEAAAGNNYVEVSATGMVHGLAIGSSRVKLVARDVTGVKMTSAEAHVEVIPITNLRVHVATQSVLVGAPCPLWLEADGLGTRVLAALQPRVTWTVREHAHLYTTHRDDKLERTIAEGLTVRVVPLKAGLITIDVRVRNMGQLGESRTWDSTVEILALNDIQMSVEGLPHPLPIPERLALAVGSTIRLKTSPRSEYKAYSEDGAFELSPSGEIRGLRAGHGAVRVTHTHERSQMYREQIIHIEVATPHYCTLEPSEDEDAVRIVLRNSIGRALLAPEANVSVYPLSLHARRAANSALGNELVISSVPASGALVTAESRGVRDEVWLSGPDKHTERYIASVGSLLCLSGTGWRAPDDVTLHVIDDVTIALLSRDAAAKHALRADRPARQATIHQLPVETMSFLAGDWPASLVPLSLTAAGSASDMVACTEQQRYALIGVQVPLPFTCVTAAPHSAEPKLDIAEGRIGCSITPGLPITTATSVELCAELGRHRTCTRASLLPPAHLSPTSVSLLTPPATFTVTGHETVLKLIKLTPSPGLKLTSSLTEGELTVSVVGEESTCGSGWVVVESRRTGQEWRVDVLKECDVACGTLLGALYTLLSPYLTTLATLAGVAVAYLYIQSRLPSKANIRMPTSPPATVLPPSPPRTWSRSPYAASGPASPIYGDASVTDTSFSPNSTRVHSRFL